MAAAPVLAVDGIRMSSVRRSLLLAVTATAVALTALPILPSPVAAHAELASAHPAPSTLSADSDSLARGERLYRANCSSCHGIDGAGDGPVVTVPGAGALADAVRRASDGELSYRIAVGIAGMPMPAFAGTLSPQERWHLVNYLRDRFGGR